MDRIEALLGGPPPLLLTEDQAALIHGVSPHTLNFHRTRPPEDKSRVIPYIRIGRTIRYPLPKEGLPYIMRVKRRFGELPAPFLRPDQASYLLGIPENTLKLWRTRVPKDGGVPFVKIGLGVRYHLPALLEFITRTTK